MDMDTAVRHEGFQGVLSFELPAPWSAEKVRPEVELFGSMPPIEGDFTPNVVVTANPFAGTLRDFSRRAVSGIVASLKEGRIVDVDEWAYRTEPPNGEGHIPVDERGLPLVRHAGRMVEYTHRAPVGRTVSGVDYLVLIDGWAVQISTTTALQTRQLFEEEFVAIARSVTALRSAAEAGVSVGEDGSVVQPAGDGIDQVASRARGEESEDYSFYQAAGSWIGEGTWMSGAAIARMGELEDSVLGRLSTGRGDPVLDELRDLGVLEGGRLSEIGDVMATALNNAPTRLRLTGRFLDAETTFQAFAIGDLALVAAEQGYGPRVLNQPWNADDPTLFNVQLIPLSELSSSASRWAGAGPAWNIHVAPFLLEPGQLEARFAGEAPLPAGANEVMEQVWNQPWFVWQIEAEGEAGAIEPITYVNTGIRGNYRVGLMEDPQSGTDKPALWTTDSSYVLRQLEDVIQAAAFGREVQWT
ncbi:hypothetical protein [Arthrobacter sp.]|uniref:hypothetical protein n=1 Tax=Arthrobacter sp. TaxID=1667 RepID=UPI003A919C0E